ncbi:caspase family protein [Bradyrhizobium lablabi]|uniref:caspase family protein n=1 Tax=Bradyrhizobium lablabi TaxID=722472 RepID=UPI001BA92927|nr:caspase family protein [Bradyrhizobium lablabi]MBR0697378.1 caspase family protein [Bradyrhizobium lablabi]
MNLYGFMKLRRLLLFAAALLLLCQPAWAGNRVALVIGNSTYKNAALLLNPANDAAIVDATLKNAGFDVVETHLDLEAADMRRTLRDFADRVRDADVAVVYYAGHGIELEGSNYLIPTDARLERDTDVYDEALSLDRVLLAIEPAKQLRLVIVDACRNNPFAEKMKRTVGSRAMSRGLARIEPATSNTLVAYAAKAGSTASDGNSKNSPYATALVKYIATPGLDLRRVFGFVRDDVMKATGNRQEPYVYGTLGGEDVPLVPAKETASKETASKEVASKETASSAVARADIRHDYELALQIGNKDALNFFLAQYPDGYYANLAKLQLAKIAAEETRVAATEKARLAQQEQERLANEGAQQTKLAKAASELKAAEEARVAAEKAKEAAQEQAAQAEQRRVAIESAAAAKNVAPVAPERQQETKADTKTAALPDPQAPAPPSQAELARSIQTELRRVGCFTGSINGEWNAESRRSLELFNQHAGSKFDVRLASVDALDGIKLKSSRVCPLICKSGFKRDGDRCSKITCAAGSFLNDDNECEKRKVRQAPPVRQAPSARHERREPPPARPNAEASAGGGRREIGMPFIFFMP